MVQYFQLKFSKTSVIICGLASFLIGLALARLRLTVSPLCLWVGLAAVLISFGRPRLETLVVICVFASCLGLWRGQNYLARLAEYQKLFGQKIVLTGIADSDGQYGRAGQLSFDMANSQMGKGHRLVGKISVRGYGEKAVYRGDKISVAGKLYKTRGSRQAGISYAKITVIARSRSLINDWRRRFEAGMLSALPEPMASFALGLLIGQRSTLPESVNDNLSAAGLTHIVAVSGYNLTIIIATVYALLKKFSKYQATVLSLTLIIIFIIFTGTSASIVRAAIVSMLSLWAGYYGRKFNPVLLILLAACLTAGWSPTYLWSDIGWYLSFLAFFGILVLAPLWSSRGGKQSGALGTVMTETIAAQLMTMPIIMYIFGRVSLVALPANVLVVPLVPLAMLLSFGAALGGMLISAVSGWLALPAKIVLVYMLDMAALVARVPHALGQMSLNLVQLIFAYLLIIMACIFIRLSNRSKDVIITDINSK